MNKPIKAEIISIGTEILRGEIIDTNASYIASQLPLVGIELHRMNAVGDDIKALCQILNQALKRSPLVITSGGLGPTQDDLTREAIATLMKEKLFVDPVLETQLRKMFSRMHREMPMHNIQQAMMIPSAESLPNPKGTAPGWWVEKNDRLIVVMPGPPREMIPMWQNEVVPRLKTRFAGEKIFSRTIKTFSVQEAKVAELTMPFFKTGNPTLGIYAKPDGIQVRLIAQGNNSLQLLDDAIQKLKEILAPNVWGTDDNTLEEIIGQVLSRQGLSLATVEDFTGGLLGHIITNSTISSQFYRGGLITNSDLTKIALGIPTDLIQGKDLASKDVVEAMAVSVKNKFSTDFGLSIGGIYHKNEPTTQSDIVYIGIADDYGVKSWQQQFMANRADSQERASVAALFRMREKLMELKFIK